MSKNKTVWSDTQGDLRKAKNNTNIAESSVNEKELILKIRRLTSGKGRTVIEVSALPKNVNWNKSLAKELKKTLGVGGSYKNNTIEVHGEKLDQVTTVLDKKNLKWKKTGG